MRARKISALALVALAAGLTLTACGNGGTNGASAAAGASAGAPAASSSTAPRGSGDDGSSAAGGQPAAATSSSAGGSSNGSSGSNGSAGGSSGGSGTADAGICQTANLSFSSSHGMAEGEVLINLTNTGAGTCTMHGFPGVDLKSMYGTVSAARSGLAAPDVTLRSGQETNFTLHFPVNNTGGSGLTFTSLVVTPPNETHAHTLSLAVNVPASNDPGPTFTVDPVGAGK